MPKSRSQQTTFLYPVGAVLALLIASCLSQPARADAPAVPGRAVGPVFLGMDRADTWKILHKPGHSDTALHEKSVYKEDTWVRGKDTLTVISEQEKSPQEKSEQDKVVQVEFDSTRITTTDGFSTHSTLDQIRHRRPAASLRAYNLVYRLKNGDERRANGFYVDDVRSGLAFIITNKAMDADYLKCTPAAIIIHKAGQPALPISAGHWLGPPVLNFAH